MGNPIIRRAKESDSAFLAWAMLESMLPGPGRGIFDLALQDTGTRPLEFHEALLRSGVNNWGQLDSFLIVEGEAALPVAAMGAFDGGMADLRPLTAEGFKTVSDYLGWSNETGRAFWRKYVSFFGLFGSAPQLFQPADYVIEYVAVAPDHRRKGYYTQLLDAHVSYARELGHSTLGGTAVYGNDAVYKAYERYGFREHSRFGPEYYRNTYPGMARMVFDL